MARTGRIGKGGHGRPKQSTVTSGSFTSHPRIDLTSAKLTELIARKDANTAEYQAIKNHADAYIDTYIGGGATSTSSLGTASSGMFTVDDGSGFPTGAHLVIIGVEIISISSRTGNTFTYDARGVTPAIVGARATANVSHATGSKVYEYKNIGHNGSAMAPIVALLDLMSVSGYADKALKMCSAAMGALAGCPPVGSGGLNLMRSQYILTVRAYDWMYSRLAAIEKAAYADCIRQMVQEAVDEPHAYDPTRNQANLEVRIAGNVAMGANIFGLLGAAATYGDNTSAQTQWNFFKNEFVNFLLPAMQTGVFAHGVAHEGNEYNDATWMQALEIVKILALQDTDYWSSIDTWMVDLSKYIFHITPPGSHESASQVSGTVTSGSTSMTVSSVSDFAVGDMIKTYGDSFNLFETPITNISGLTFTLGVAPTENVTGNPVTHMSHILVFGDMEGLTNKGFGVGHWAEGHKYAIYQLIDRLRTRNPTYAGYMKWFCDNLLPAPASDTAKLFKFLNYDPSVTGVDYTAVLSPSFSTTQANATGILINRSAWTNTATYSWFLPHSRVWYHNHSDYNTYGIQRKGVILSREVDGWGANGDEGLWFGAKFHNSVSMNGHSGYHGAHSLIYDNTNDRPGPSTLSRYDLTSSYAYARGDASLPFVSTGWTTSGYLNNDAQTFVRDYIHINPDLIVFQDRLAYANATLSPTKWYFHFPGDPSLASQRITMTTGGQTLIQDVVLPTSAVFTEIAQSTENALTGGYRMEVVSNATVSSEYGLNVIQLGDSGFSPAAVTTLTTTNANVVKVATLCVVGFVKGASPTLNITYDVTGLIKHYIIGMAPSTAYHVTKAVNTITIAAATGSGDTTSTAGGVLEFTI